MTRTVSVLGATGSVGRSTLDLIERSPEAYEVVALTAATNVDTLADAARRTGARLAVVADESRLSQLEARLAGTNCRAAAGGEALIEACVAPSPPIAKILSRTRNVMSTSHVRRSSASGSAIARRRTSSNVLTASSAS